MRIRQDQRRKHRHMYHTRKTAIWMIVAKVSKFYNHIVLTIDFDFVELDLNLRSYSNQFSPF